MRFFLLPVCLFLTVLGVSHAQTQVDEHAQEKNRPQPRQLGIPQADSDARGFRKTTPIDRSRASNRRDLFRRSSEPSNSRLRLRDSIRSIERDTGGRVLRAESFSRGGNEVHRVKVLTPDGRVRIMQNNPRPQSEVIVHPVQTPGID